MKALSPRELLFVEAYCGVAEFNAAKAYAIAGYKPHRHNAARLLKKGRIAAAVAAKVTPKLECLKIMDGDEALERITAFARGDIRKLFPPEHFIARLPDEVAVCIKSVTPNKFGLRIECYDALRANELMAKSAGKLKDIVKVERTLEDILSEANRMDREQPMSGGSAAPQGGETAV